MALTGDAALGAGAAAGDDGAALGAWAAEDAGAPACGGMKGLAGTPAGGCGLGPAGLTVGEASCAGAVVACPKATETAKGKQMSPLINRTSNFIEPAHASRIHYEAHASLV
ncbi:MAG TPA: hypothetical protein VFE63_00085 [Roseiarcus sp.]|jgi:hypothetical protein|nr:hypothetical protein [Roseiarcus sp.]